MDRQWYVLAKWGEKSPPAPSEDAEVMTLTKGWQIRPLREYRMTDRIDIIESFDGQPESIEPGDWKMKLGEWFSGDAEYSIDFEIEGKMANRPCWLDLGTVRYACEVILNGQPIGRRAWKPFLYDLTGKLKAGKNRMLVVVTNTLANATLNPKTIDLWESFKGKTWPKDVLMSDHTLPFEAESLSSGLFGPIQLLYGPA